MNIALITKDKDYVNLELYDNNLKVLAKESFSDLYTLNFFLQTIPKRYKENKTLLIYNNLENLNFNINNNIIENQNLYQKIQNIKLILAEDENSYFID